MFDYFSTLYIIGKGKETELLLPILVVRIPFKNM